MPGPWCRKCRYDLAGVAPDLEGGFRCPECGRPFDLADPATTLPKIIPWWRTPLAIRVGRSGAVIVLFAVAFWFNWLPRPAAPGWRLWEWRGSAYGVARDTLAGRRVSYRLWDDAVTRIIGFTATGAPAYVAGRTDDGRWRIEILDRAATFGEIETAARRLGEFLPDVAYIATQPGPAEAPVVIEGDATAVMERLLAAYGLEPAVHIRRYGDDHFSLRVVDPDVPFEDVMDAFNTLRDRRFGVLTRAAPTTVIPRPFSVEGTEADAFWTAVLAYDRIVDKPELVPAMTSGWHPTGDPAPNYREMPRRRVFAPIQVRRAEAPGMLPVPWPRPSDPPRPAETAPPTPPP